MFPILIVIQVDRYLHFLMIIIFDILKFYHSTASSHFYKFKLPDLFIKSALRSIFQFALYSSSFQVYPDHLLIDSML